MAIVEVDPDEVDFSGLDAPTGSWRGEIMLAGGEIDHGDIPSGVWVVDGIWDVPEQMEGVPTRIISFKTRSGWVGEKYYGNGRLARQEICYEDSCVQKRKKWSQDGTLLLEENWSAPDEIAEAVKKDGQVAIRREYYTSGQVRSELVAVEMDYYYEGDPQLYFVSVGYDQDGRVTARSHAKVA
ncbi:hypothetical protein [uncultured Varibaculum sp.]|uniref:hypothetical protein n=1 Tax=uncultured Varibaculum sp. TaxID=413896 RepID=UPI002888F9C0|nr:hypothetical protein [uncultured Varibaculum sp.]